MNSGKLFESRDIILTMVKFPNQKPKQRPVLVISKFSKNNNFDTFVYLPITSNIPNDQFSLEINSSDTEDGALLKPSVVLYHYYFTELKNTGVKKLCKVSDKFHQILKEKIHQEVLDI